MVEPIASAEVFPDVVVTPPVAPKHTAEGHENCAYYTRNRLECGHGEEAAGGFYSEDFLRELKHEVHLLIGVLDKIQIQRPKFGRNGRVGPTYLIDVEMNQLQFAMETLRELTK